MTRVVNVYRENCDVYIGRAGKGHDGYFGNPFLVTQHGERTIEKYREWFLERVSKDADFRKRIEALKGKALG